MGRIILKLKGETKLTTDAKVDLQIEKDALYEQLVETHREINEIRPSLNLLEDRYRLLKLQYEKVDHSLALVDGRLEKITEIKKGERKVAEISTDAMLKKMSPEAIAALCKSLNLE